MPFWNRHTTPKLVIETLKAKLGIKEQENWTQFSFSEYCKRFDMYYNNYPKLKAACLTIAGQTIAHGIFLKQDKDYPRAQEALQLCEDFNKQVGMDQLVYETVIPKVKYGTVFWELTNQPVFDVGLIPRQKDMFPIWTNRAITGWALGEYGQKEVEWNAEDIAVFAWNKGENDPFGTSLFTGIDRELNTTDTIMKNLLTYLTKQAWASNILQVGDKEHQADAATMTSLIDKIKNRGAGEDFVVNWPIAAILLGVGAIETRMIPDTLRFCDDQITDSVLMPPISKLYNSTEASATVMSDWARANIITPIQRSIKRVIEKQVYARLLENSGFSVKLVPSISFQPPDENKNEDAAYYVQLVNAGLCSREEASKKLGTDWKKIVKEQKEREEQMMKMQQTKAQTFTVKKQEEGGNEPDRPNSRKPE